MDINPYQSIGLTTSRDVNEQTANDELGQDAFLELMTTQLQNQDPLAPMDNGDFLGQIAQFGTVSGVNDLNESFGAFASSLQSSQALEASNLIGRHVFVNSNEAYLSADSGMSGAIELPSSASNVALNVYDESGAIIGRVDLGTQQSGLVQFNWDGVTLSGQKAPSGRYHVEAEATMGSQTEALTPLIGANVVSLTLGGIGTEMQVELENLGKVGFSHIQQIL